MTFLRSLFFKVIIYIGYRKEDYIFSRSRKFINSWGEGAYGVPRITCFDGVSRLSVGNYVSIADKVTILLGSNHRLGLITTYPWRRINEEKASVTNEKGDVKIGNDVWIGFGATIIGPVTIGDGAIIGAGAVVVNDIPPYAVAVGVPARPVKYRFSDDEINKLETIQWWNWDVKKIKQEESAIWGTDIKEFIAKFHNV